MNRFAVIIACFFWLPLINVGNRGDDQHGFFNDMADKSMDSTRLGAPYPFSLFWNTPTLSGLAKHLVFVAVLLIGVLEELSGSANMISMERDWVPTIASQTDHARSDGPAYTLTHLNAVMRRIDLICKLFSPILISLIISFTRSVRVGVVVVGGMSLTSWSLEWWCALRVWRGSPQLRRPKISAMLADSPDGIQSQQSTPSSGSRLSTWLQGYFLNMKRYFDTEVWMPSMALAMLHLSMLSYSAPFITHLLNAGFSLPLISAARAASGVIEISSTFVMPWDVWYLSRSPINAILDNGVARHVSDDSPLLGPDQPDHNEAEDSGSGGLERLGLWGLWGQLICLVGLEF